MTSAKRQISSNENEIHPLTDGPTFTPHQHGGMPTSESKSLRMYWVAIGLFSAVFLGSATFGLLDLNGSKTEWLHLGYPWWTFFALTAGKVVGVATIASNRLPRIVKDFAFAGFFYELLLAGGAHLSIPEVKVLLAVAGLAVWAFAFIMDSRRFPRAA
jgi:hypothetical protein